MSRTYRRRGERHDYDSVLRDYRWVNGALVPFLIDARSRGDDAPLPAFTLTHTERCVPLHPAGTGASPIIVFAQLTLGSFAAG